MNYLKLSTCDIANGPGVRVTLWVSGCRQQCKGCHNPETWDFNAGTKIDDDFIDHLLKELDKPWIDGLTLSGGHPLEYENLPGVYDIIDCVRKKLPNKTIWLYTGYELSMNRFDTTVDICWDNGLLRNFILAMCDVVVDGPYIEEQRDISLKWCGSRNQRVIDVKKSIAAGEIVLYED